MIVVKKGQNILDVCIEAFGTLEELDNLLIPNNLTLNSKLQSGQELTITTTNIGDEDVKNFVVLKDISYNNSQGTGDPPIFGGDYNDDYNIDYL